MLHPFCFYVTVLLYSLLCIPVPMHAQQRPVGQNRLTFIENRGQIVDTDGNVRPDITYVASSGGMNVYFTSSGVSYVFVRQQETAAGTAKKPSILAAREVERSVSTWRVDMELLGARPNVRPLPEERTEEYFNYYYAHCPDGITNVPSYRRLVYSNVYHNIDMVFYENGQGLKYDFVVRPGGRVADIRFRYSGAQQTELTSEGRLVVSTPLGTVQEYAPVSYQTSGVLPHTTAVSQSEFVGSRFTHTGEEYGFALADHDPAQTLVIDPEVQWATYLGGSGDDGAAHTVAVDSDNNIVIRGEASSSNFPVTAGALQTTKAGGYDVFIAKLTNAGQRLWVTYYGGSNDESDRKLGGVAIGEQNDIAITGQTKSIDFPVSPGGFQTVYGGGDGDTYIIKLSADGERIWSTLYGGARADRGYSIAVDAGGNVVVSGETESRDFPVSPDAFQPTFGGGESDAFVVKLDENGQRLWGTYYGGGIRYYELGFDIAVDSKSNILIAGMTGSADFPVSPGAFQTTYAGNDFDAFLIKLDADGNRLWATLYGGRYTDQGVGVAVDREDNILLVGNSRSADFPVTNDAYQRNLANNEAYYDAVVIKFDEEGSRLWATYYGGGLADVATKVWVGKDNELYITGLTESSNFPVTTDAVQQENKGGVDCFILVMTTNGYPIWSSYYGGSQNDESKGITLDRNGNIVISGHTNSTDFPTTANAFQQEYGGGANDAFIVKFGGCSLAAPTVTASGPTTFCAGDSVTLDAGAGYASYLWSNGASTRRIVVTQSGVFSVTVLDSANCAAASLPVTIVVQQPPVPVISALGPTTFCAGDSVTLDAGAGYASYLWSTGELTRSIVVRNAGSYSVRVATAAGCAGTSADVAVTLEVCDSVQCDVLSGVINSYSAVTAIGQSTATLTVTAPVLFTEGDQVLLLQMQGALIDTFNTETYGTVQYLNGAGNYEFAVVKEVRGNIISLTAPLVHTDYDVQGHIQLVRVPQYDHATVTGVLTCAPWNGETGGVLAFAANCLILDGTIDVSGMGFRGAQYEDQPGSVTQPHYGQYVSDNAYYWAMKGEGIAGNGVAPFIYGKGSPANGGGGGNNHNAGGGGGSNYGSGGMGGYGYQGVPGSIKIPQGVGGKSLAALYGGRNTGRLFAGGGGGSGHINHAHGSHGANGGGLAFIRAHRLRSTGSHTIAARGETAPADSSTVNPDGCGGGGAGGSILLDVAIMENGVTLDVSGGNGGSRSVSLTSSGPGGGGSGGTIVLTGDTTQFAQLTTVMQGGMAGTEPGGKNYGAADGQPGGRRAAFAVAGLMQTPELSGCKGCMPVLQRQERLCGKTLVVVSDVGTAITEVQIDEAGSSNAVVSVVSSLPSKFVTVEVGLDEPTQAGRYELTIRNASGREIRVGGEVYPLPAVPEISFNGQMLISTPAARYQWYYNGNALYNGEDRNYRPLLGGEYTVRITDGNGCSAWSEPFVVLLTGVREQGGDAEVVVQPNPAGERLMVRIDGKASREVSMDIRNVLGMVVLHLPAATVEGVCEQTLDVAHLPAGVYFLHIGNGGENIVRKFIKN